MKILHLSNHCIFGNGNVHAAVDLACEQAKQGHSVYFASGGGDFEQLLLENGVTHFSVAQSGSHIPTLLKSIGQLRSLIKRHRIDVVHAHMMSGAVLGWAATRFGRAPLVTTVHNAFDSHAVLMGLGDKVIAVSQAVAENMAKRGVARRKLATVLNGTLGAARTLSLSDVPADLPRPSITTICGLHDRKGIRHLLNAFEHVADAHPAAHLNIIGEGPQEAEYRQLAGTLRASDRIHFWGQLRNPKPYLKSTDIFVLASLQDPCPLVIPEAREMGCAIVATDVDGIPEMLAIGNAGIAVPAQNADAIAHGVLALLDDPNMLSAQRTASLEGVEYFQISRVCSQTVEVYGSLVRV